MSHCSFHAMCIILAMYPRRRNVTTLMVGLKNGHIRRNLTQKWWTPEIAGERKKQNKTKKNKKKS